MFQRMEAMVGRCRVGGVSSAKTIIKGLKETGLGANNGLQEWNQQFHSWLQLVVTPKIVRVTIVQ